jgi:hypothetical protein
MQAGATRHRKLGLCALLLTSAVMSLAALRFHRNCRALALRAISDGASRLWAAGWCCADYIRSLQLLDAEVGLVAGNRRLQSSRPIQQPSSVDPAASPNAVHLQTGIGARPAG